MESANHSQLTQQVNQMIEHLRSIYGNVLVCTRSDFGFLAPELNAPMIFDDSIAEIPSGDGSWESTFYVIPLGIAIEHINRFTPESQKLVRDYMFRIIPPVHKRAKERQRKERPLWVTQKEWVRR